MVLIAAECSKHDRKGIPYKDYGDLVNNKDPYFSCLGGYDCFRASLALDPQEYDMLGLRCSLPVMRRGMDWRDLEECGKLLLRTST